MNLEKLGLAVWLKAQGERSQIEDRLKSSFKELALVGLQSLSVLQEATLESEILKENPQAHKTLEQFDALSKELIQSLEASLKQESASKKDALYADVVGEILEGIEDEIEARQSPQNSKTKGEKQVLESVAKVLQRRLLQKNDAPSDESSASSKKVANQNGPGHRERL